MTLTEKNIMEILSRRGTWYELKEHNPVYTCEQAEEITGSVLLTLLNLCY